MANFRLFETTRLFGVFVMHSDFSDFQVSLLMLLLGSNTLSTLPIAVSILFPQKPKETSC